jgi:hypothetical protein
MPETFGEADVVLRVRLEQLQRELDESERMIQQSNERVMRQQEAAASSFQGSSAESNGGGSGILGTVVGFGAAAAHNAARALMLQRALAAVAVAGRAAFTALGRLAGLAALPLFLGDIIKTIRHIPEYAARAKDAIVEFARAPGEHIQNALYQMREFRNSLPIIGWAAKQIETTISELSGLLGGPNWLQDIEDAGEHVKRTAEDMKVFRQTVQATKGNARELRDELQQIHRQVAMVGQTGQAGLSIGSLFQMQDIEGAADERVRSVTGKFTDMLRERKALLKAGDIDEGQFERDRRQIERAKSDQLQLIEENRRAQLAAAEELYYRRSALLKRELAERQSAGLDELIMGNRANKLRLAGDEFGAQRMELEQQRRRKLDELQANGNADLVAQVDEHYATLAELINQREQEAIDQQQRAEEMKTQAQIDAISRRAEAIGREMDRVEQDEIRRMQANEQLRSQILEQRLRDQGRDIEAREEAIRRSAQAQIDRFEADGNEVGAKLARQLRDLQIEALGNIAAGRDGEFRQVSAARSTLDDTGRTTEGYLERTARGVEKLVRNTKRPQPAKAG